VWILAKKKRMKCKIEFLPFLAISNKTGNTKFYFCKEPKVKLPVFYRRGPLSLINIVYHH
jgi:hypothetical protein